MSITPRYVTLAGAAERLHRDPGTVRNWLRKGIFPGYRLPGARGVHVDLNEVEEGLRKAGLDVRPNYGEFGPNAVIRDLRNGADGFPSEGQR